MAAGEGRDVIHEYPVSDDYRTERALSASGGFSKLEVGFRIKDASHVRSGYRVAIKYVIKAPSGQSMDDFFEHEVNTHWMVTRATRAHPNLLLFLDAYRWRTESGQKRYAIVTQLASGGDLIEFLMSKPEAERSEARLARYFAQALAGLAAMHESMEGCLLHRDIKPDNLFLSSDAEDAQVVIGDFGCTVKVADLGEAYESREWAGTKAYNAPETFSSVGGKSGRWTAASDIWSLGASIHSGLSLSFPFAPVGREFPPGVDGVKERIRQGRYRPLPASASSSAKDIVKRILQVDAKKRPTATEALQDPWIKIQQGDSHLRFVAADLARFSRELRFRAALKPLQKNEEERGSGDGGGEGDGGVVVDDAARERSAKPALSEEQMAALAAADPGDTGGVIAPDVIRRIRHVFAERCDPVTGEVGAEDFVDVMREVGLGELPLRRVFETMDTDESGAVSAEELIRGLLQIVRPGEERLRTIFDMYDRDGDGKVGVDEFALMLRFTATSDAALERVKCDRMAELFGKLDPENKGCITWEAFKDACENDGEFEGTLRAFTQPNRFFRDYVTRSKVDRLVGSEHESGGFTTRIRDAVASITGNTSRAAEDIAGRRPSGEPTPRGTPFGDKKGKGSGQDTRTWLLAALILIVILALAVRMLERQQENGSGEL